MRLKKDLKLVVIMMLCSSWWLMSCSVDDNAIEDLEYDYRTILNSLDWGEDTVFVYGHKTPDADAICSALAYAKLMRTLGYNCKAKVSGPINRETQYIAQRFGFDVPEDKSEVMAGTRLILTDHTDYVQCVNGAREAVILQKIDHHVEGDILDIMIPFVRREMVGSTCTVVYECYKELGVAIDDETAKILLAGLISDTRNLSKSTTCHIDSIAWTALVSQLKLEDDVDEINRQMDEAANNYEGMTDLEIFFSDNKDYGIGGKAIGIGSMVCKAAEADGFVNRMLAVMPDVMNYNQLDMVFAMILIQVPNPDQSNPDIPYVNGVTDFIYYGEGAKEVAEALFGPSLLEVVTYTKENLSRKQIVPLMKEIIE